MPGGEIDIHGAAGSNLVIKVRPVESPTKSAIAASAKKALLREIGARWRKFSETELTLFSTKDDVVRQVAMLYGVEKSQALIDVDAVFKGRRL